MPHNAVPCMPHLLEAVKGALVLWPVQIVHLQPALDHVKWEPAHHTFSLN